MELFGSLNPPFVPFNPIYAFASFFATSFAIDSTYVILGFSPPNPPRDICPADAADVPFFPFKPPYTSYTVESLEHCTDVLPPSVPSAPIPPPEPPCPILNVQAAVFPTYMLFTTATVPADPPPPPAPSYLCLNEC